MRAVVQRVSRASVTADGVTAGEIGGGYLVLLGVLASDTRREAEVLAAKIAALRVFPDEAGKMNRSCVDTAGEILTVSQFTLCADLRRGNRPSFTPSAPPDRAERLYEYFMLKLLENGVKRVAHGVFGAHMEVSLVNDGPVTILLDTDTWCKK